MISSAGRILQRAARAAYDEGVLVNLGLSLLFLGAVAAERGDHALAARRLGAGERHFGMVIPAFIQSSVDVTIAQLTQSLAPERLDALLADGASLSLDAALALAEAPPR